MTRTWLVAICLSGCARYGVDRAPAAHAHAARSSRAPVVNVAPVTSSSAPATAPEHANAGDAPATARVVTLPGGSPGIGFEDLRYAPALGRMLVPAGRSGNLDLIDPATLDVTVVSGFSQAPSWSGTRSSGANSADEGPGVLYVTDRDTNELRIVSSPSLALTGKVKLAAEPNYVRYVAPTREVWVTEPDAMRIEVFGAAAPWRGVATQILVGGPESLVVDGPRAVAYTHLWHGKTLKLDVKTRGILGTWPNGCRSSRGIALDRTRQLVFVGCAEGKAVVLDARTGATLSSATVGAGVDIIAYAPRLAHLYVPSAHTGTLSIFGVGPNGQLAPLGHVNTPQDAHCVAADDRANVYICDPHHGRLLLVHDRYPRTTTTAD